MKTYRYKDKNGNWVRSIYPKPSEIDELIAEGIIFLAVLGGIIIWLLFFKGE